MLFFLRCTTHWALVASCKRSLGHAEGAWSSAGGPVSERFGRHALCAVPAAAGILPGVKVDEAWARPYLLSLTCQSQPLC